MKSLKPRSLDSLKSQLGVADPEVAVPVLGAASLSALAAGLSTGSRDGAVKGVAAAGLAFDLVGGLGALHWPSNRRAFARKDVPERLLFTGIHVQPFVLPAIGQGTWGHATRRYLTALGASAALELFVPRSRLRPALATATAAVLALGDWRRSRGQQNRWLGPVILLKLISGHAGIRQIGGEVAEASTSGHRGQRPGAPGSRSGWISQPASWVARATSVRTAVPVPPSGV